MPFYAVYHRSKNKKLADRVLADQPLLEADSEAEAVKKASRQLPQLRRSRLLAVRQAEIVIPTLAPEVSTTVQPVIPDEPKKSPA